MKEKLFVMRFTAPSNVELYEDGRTLCAVMDSAESAKARARALCPDGYRLRLTSSTSVI